MAGLFGDRNHSDLLAILDHGGVVHIALGVVARLCCDARGSLLPHEVPLASTLSPHPAAPSRALLGVRIAQEAAVTLAIQSAERPASRAGPRRPWDLALVAYRWLTGVPGMAKHTGAMCSSPGMAAGGLQQRCLRSCQTESWYFAGTCGLWASHCQGAFVDPVAAVELVADTVDPPPENGQAPALEDVNA